MPKFFNMATTELNSTKTPKGTKAALHKSKSRGVSIRYKILLLLTVLPLLTLGAYLMVAIGIFEDDKVQYVLDSSTSVARSVAVQTKAQLSAVLYLLKPAMQEYIDTEKLGSISDSIVKGEAALSSVFIYKPNGNGAFDLQSKIEKSEGSVDSVLKAVPDIQGLLSQTEKDGRVVRAPFSDERILILERVGQTSEARHFILCTVYFAKELADVFSAPSKNSLYLVGGSGEILFGRDRHVGDNLSDIVPKDVILGIVNSRTLDGTNTVKNKNKSEWLLSYSKTGHSDLFVVSVIEKSLALEAVKKLIRKSLLFFGLLICITVIVSIIASGNLTAALTDLLGATKRVAEGKFDIKVKVDSSDEIGSLADSFNLMADEVSRLIKETAENARMQGELKTAQTVQETLFPAPFAHLPGGLEIAGYYEPASECGGDWWHYSVVDDKIFLWIGDATGHGAPAALITSAAKSAATIIERLKVSPAEAMSLLNRSIYDVSKGRIMMTFFLACYDSNTREFTYCNASHEPPYLIQRKDSAPKKKDLIPLNEVNNPRLGQSRDSSYQEHKLTLSQGDMVFFYTDGIPDVRDLNDQSMGERGFVKTIIDTMRDCPTAETFVERFSETIKTFRTTAQLVDDITFFVCKS